MAGHLSVRESPVPEARYFNNPTRNEVPCGVASAVLRRRAESTLLSVYVISRSGVSPTRCYAYGRTPPTLRLAPCVGLLGYRAFGTGYCDTLGRGYRQQVVRRPSGLRVNGLREKIQWRCIVVNTKTFFTVPIPPSLPLRSLFARNRRRQGNGTGQFARSVETGRAPSLQHPPIFHRYRTPGFQRILNPWSGC